MFYLFYNEAYSHITDTNLTFMLIQNQKNKNLDISWHTHLSIITEYNKEKCYNSTVNDLKIVSLQENKPYNEIQLANKITIYKNNKNIIKQLAVVTNIYLNVWHDTKL